MKTLRVEACLLACLLLATSAFGQSSNGTLSGTVVDSSRALIPGVTIKATNTETGIVSTGVTNESGAYTVPGLLPGSYAASAVQPGFQTQTFTDIRIGNAAQVRLNFTLQVSSVNTVVEVTTSADRLLLESTSSVGAVLPQDAVRSLPIVGAMGNDAMGLVRTLPGRVQGLHSFAREATAISDREEQLPAERQHRGDDVAPAWPSFNNNVGRAAGPP